jgi:hypothetical protein
VVDFSVGESNGVAAATLTVPRPAATLQNGDLLILAARCGSSVQTTDYARAGWSRKAYVFAGSSAGNRVTGFYSHFVTDATSEPSSYVFDLVGNAFARQAGIIILIRAGVGAVPFTSEPATNFGGAGTPSGTTVTLDTFTAPAASLLLFAMANELVTPNATATWTPPAGSTIVATRGHLTNQSDTSGTRSIIGVASQTFAAGGTAGGGTITVPAASSLVSMGLSIAGSEQAVTPPAVRRFSSVAQLLATKGATVIHRAPTGFAESTKDTAQRASDAGFSAFEFSCGWSSDLVPFGNGYQYLDPLALGNGAGTTLDSTTMTWATISGTYQVIGGSNGPKPFYRLVDFLTDFVDSGKGIALVDPKFGFDTVSKIDTMLDICDAHGGPSKIIIKFDTGTPSTNLTSRAHARGYLCMNWWNLDTTALAAQQANWDILGMAYNGGGAVWTAVKSYGKKTWAAIVPNAAALAQAITDTSADFYMVKDFVGITPVGPTASGVSTKDLERSYLLSISTAPNENNLSTPDLRFLVYGGRQTPYAADPATGRSATDVEIAARRTASSNPNKQQLSLTDLRREAWGG